MHEAVARNWRDDMRDSSRNFQQIIWPEISRYVGGGTLKSLETGGDDLDRTGGIDGYQLLQNGIRTIAQRTQSVDDYRKPATFTVRYSRPRTRATTEFRKRLDALDHGFDIPGLVIQAYIHTEQRQLIRVGIAHGRPFYEYALRQPQRWSKLHARDDGNEFLVIPFWCICVDNQHERSEVPFLGKDGLGVVHRSPIPFFDRHACYFTDLRRQDKSLRWI